MRSVVIIGCGAVLEFCHRGALERAAKRLGLRVVGLVDPDPMRRASAQKWFPGAEGFSDTDACFAKLSPVQLTVVTSPPPLHATHAEAAFKHGSHVLCEKPLAGSSADAERILTASTRSGKVLSLGMTRRFYPCLAEVRRRISGGALGANLTFTYREGEPYDWLVTSAAPFRRETSGGGVLLDKGVHALDSLRFIFGSGSVKAHADDAPVESVEANAITELQFDRAVGTMQLSWDMNLSSGLHIIGSEGEYWLPIGPLDELFSRGGARQPWRREQLNIGWPIDLEASGGKRGCPIDYNDCFWFQLLQTLRAIDLGEGPAATAQDGVATLRIIASAYAIARPLEKPWFSPTEQAFYRQHHWRS